MKKILIIAPHFPPSNLAGVHRSRLFATHLKALGWEPVILTVHEQFYEEELDWNLHQLLPKDLRIERVSAFKVTNPRVIGDIGLRAYFQIRKKALELLRSEKFDFIYISIPSFYVALLGPALYKWSGVKYGIDYIDPWVHQFPGSDKIFSRHWWSSQLAKWLEPIAVKKAALITGVSKSYYQGVIERNPRLSKTCIFGAMPYGGEPLDHQFLKELNIQPYLFDKRNKIQIVYAGAILPKSILLIKWMFNAIKNNFFLFNDVEFHFIGTGKFANDDSMYSVKEMAEKLGLWQDVIFEYPKRIPYLDVLSHLNAVDGILVVGSTEPHYTPSKIFQGVLSEKPIMAVLHKESSAVKLFEEQQIGKLLAIDDQPDQTTFENEFMSAWLEYKQFLLKFNPDSINKKLFQDFTAKKSAEKLVDLLNLV